MLKTEGHQALPMNSTRFLGWHRLEFVWGGSINRKTHEGLADFTWSTKFFFKKVHGILYGLQPEGGDKN